MNIVTQNTNTKINSILLTRIIGLYGKINSILHLIIHKPIDIYIIILNSNIMCYNDGLIIKNGFTSTDYINHNIGQIHFIFDMNVILENIKYQVLNFSLDPYKCDKWKLHYNKMSFNYEY